MYYVEVETPGTVLVAEELLAKFTNLSIDDSYVPSLENYSKFLQFKYEKGIWITIENRIYKYTLFRTDEVYSNIQKFIKQTYARYCNIIIRINSENSMERIEYHPYIESHVHYPCSGDWFFIE